MEHATNAIHRMGARGGLPYRIALSTLLVGILATLALQNAVAALGSGATSGSVGFASGTVSLSDDDAGRAMLSLPNAGPGSTVTSHITVSYDGTLPSTVHLLGETSGTGLARFLILTVTRGSGTGRGFVPDRTDFTGAGPGVVYRGTLADFPGTYGAAVPDPGTWRTSDSHVFRFRVTLSDDDGAQGLSADASFLWEARNA